MELVYSCALRTSDCTSQGALLLLLLLFLIYYYLLFINLLIFNLFAFLIKCIYDVERAEKESIFWYGEKKIQLMMYKIVGLYGSECSG